MPNVPLRFSTGQGLEAASNSQTQTGYIDLDNVSLELRETIEKRPGSEQIALTIGSNPEDILDSEGLQNVAYRSNELCVWTDNQLYSRNFASTNIANEQPVGQATDEQIQLFKQRAQAEDVTTRSFTLPGHLDAALVTDQIRSIRPTTQSISGTYNTIHVGTPANDPYSAEVSIGPGGRLTFSGFVDIQGPGGRSFTVNDILLESANAEDVRVGLLATYLAQPDQQRAYFIVSYRVANILKTKAVIFGRRVIGPIDLPGSFDGQDFVDVEQWDPDRTYDIEKNYDLLNQNIIVNKDGDPPLTDHYAVVLYTYDNTGLQSTIWYQNDIPSEVPNVQEYIRSIPGLTINDGDIIRGVADPVNGQQTAALFKYFGSTLSYTVLTLFGAGPQIGPTLNVGAIVLNCPNVIASTDTNNQIVGIPNGSSVGWTIFVGDQSNIDWVAAVKDQSGDQVTSTHTCEARLDPNTWVITRNEETIMTQSLGASSSNRAVLSIDNVLVALRIVNNTLYRDSWQPGSVDGPFVQFVSMGGGRNLSVGQIVNRIAYLYTGVITNNVVILSSADGISFHQGIVEALGVEPYGYTGTVVGRLIDMQASGVNEIEATWYYYSNVSGQILLNRRFVETDNPIQGSVLSIAVASASQIYAEDIGIFDLIYVVDTNGRIVIYEFGADYTVQVNPRLLSIASGNFGFRGPWTVSRLAQETPIVVPGGGTIVAADVAEVDRVRLIMFEVSGGSVPGIYLSIYSDHFELLNGNLLLVDATGSRPKVTVNQKSGSVLLTYLQGAPNTNRISYAVWMPGSNIVFSDLSDGVNPVVAQDSIYDTLSVSTIYDTALSDKFLVMSKNSGTNLRLTRLSSDGTLQISETVNIVSTITGAVAVCVESIQDTEFILRGAAATTTAIRTFRAQIPDGGGLSVITPSSNAYVVLGTDVRRMAIASPFGDARYNIAYETFTFVQLIRNSVGETASEYKNFYINSLFSSAISTYDGHSYVVLSGSSTANTGYFVVDLDSDRYAQGSTTAQEVVSRSFAGEGELNNINRTTLVHLDHPSRNSEMDESRLTFGTLVQNRGTILGTANLGTLGISTITFDPKNFVPAELDRVIVHAHGGYMRAYAGDVPYEHDWHGFPVCSLTTQNVGGLLTPGVYGVGVNYEETDPQNNLYRSATFFTSITVPAGTNTNQITVSVIPLALTERRNVVISAWRTEVNKSVYYRDKSVSNNPNAVSNTSMVLTRSDSSLRTFEILDTSRLTRTPTPSTDFVAAIKGRFFTRDPERGSLVRYTTTRFEGFAPSGNFSLGVESPSQRDVTAVGEFDGRVILFTQFGYSAFQGQGPDITGVGSFSESDLIPAQIGCIGQPTVTMIENGLIFGSINGPKLLTRGIDTQDFGDKIYKFFENDNYQVIRSLYVPQQESVYIYATDQINDLTLKYHTTNHRWAKDTGKQILSAAVASEGEIAYLTRDGRLLLEGDDLTQTRYQPLLAMRSVLGITPTYFWAGDPVEEVRRGTPNQIELIPSGGAFQATNNSLGVFGQTSFEFTGLDNQYYTAPTNSITDITGSTVIIWHARHDINPSGVKCYLGKQDQTGVLAQRGWFSFGGTLGPTFRLASDITTFYDVNLTTASYGPGEDRIFVAVIDYTNQQIRFGSDAENGTPIAFDAALDYTTTALFRCGDIRHQNAGQQAFDGQQNFVVIIHDPEYATNVQDPQFLAQQIKSALDTGSGVASIAVLTDRSDGGQNYVTKFTTPPLRLLTQDQKIHSRFILQSAKISGTYLGSHNLFVNIYLNFDPVPAVQGFIPRSVIDEHALQHKPYIYEIDVKKECFAAIIEISDGGEANQTFRIDALDVTWDGVDAPKQYTLGASAKFQKLVTTV